MHVGVQLCAYFSVPTAFSGGGVYKCAIFERLGEIGLIMDNLQKMFNNGNKNYNLIKKFKKIL